ncbi:MAG: peroxiredoxin [Pseudonocardiaceae bacterium]
MISIGEHVPDVEVMVMTADGLQRVRTGALLGSGKAVLFAVPGAFTPVCSDFHLPGFVLTVDDLKAKGVDTIACVSVNDPFVMGAWGDAEGTKNDIMMLADTDGAFTSAMGMNTDASEHGLGARSQRYAAILQDGRITKLLVEEHYVDHAVSTADAVLAEL